MTRLLLAIPLFLLSFFGTGGVERLLAHAQSEAVPDEQQHVVASAPASLEAGKDWVEEKTGDFVPLASRFVDEEGQGVSLADIIDRPTLLLPIYFYCPSACSQNLANLAASLKQLKSVPGKDFRVIAYSFNERETTDDARRAKWNYLKLAGESFPAGEWRYLTGGRDAVMALSTAIGYRFQKMEDGTYIHPSALVAVAGDGKIIRYVYGTFIPGDIDIAIADAAKGTPSLSVKRLLGMCFGSDPDANKAVFSAVKVLVSIAFVGGVAAFMLYARKRGRRAENDRT